MYPEPFRGSSDPEEMLLGRVNVAALGGRGSRSIAKGGCSPIGTASTATCHVLHPPTIGAIQGSNSNVQPVAIAALKGFSGTL